MNLAGKRNFQCDSAVTRYNDVYINYVSTTAMITSVTRNWLQSLG